MFCPNCGSDIPDDAGFCTECGFQVSDYPPTKATPSSPDEPAIPREKSQSNIPADAGTINEPPGTPLPPLGSSTRVQEHQHHPRHRNQHRHPPRSRRRRMKIASIFALVTSAAVGTFFVVVVATWGDIQGDDLFVHDSGQGPQDESWVFSAETSDIHIEYDDSPSAPDVTIDIHYDISGPFLKDKALEDIFTVSWDNASAVKHFHLDTKSFIMPMFDRTIVQVILKEGNNFTLSVATTTGDISCNVPGNESLAGLNMSATTGDIISTIGKNATIHDNFRLEVTTGKIQVDIGENVTIGGNFSTITTTGDITSIFRQDSSIHGKISQVATTGDVEMNATGLNLHQQLELAATTGKVKVFILNSSLENIISLTTTTGDVSATLSNINYRSDIHISVDVTTGDLKIDLLQEMQMAANVTGSMTASTGDMDVTCRVNGTNIGASFVGVTSTGNIDFNNLAGFQALGNIFQSTNYGAASSTFNFSMITTTGNIEVSGELL
ncbi:zinc-ribbon domain-containing protein [Candidatus Bathyarchaeota archaeon]|nr:zinc-ribbon domain-containing protein [Candidatus Bathyarchaeota archaeon]